MKKIDISFTAGDQDKFEELLTERIAFRNKRKKVINIEVKTVGDYIKTPVRFCTTGLIDLGTGEALLNITNPELIIGALFTFEDKTQKFDYYNNWGVEGINFKIGFSAADRQTESHIRGILEHWIGCTYYDNILKPDVEVWKAYIKSLEEQGYNDPSHKKHSDYLGKLWLRDRAATKHNFIID
tara:strand:- start:2915 stop:3463 length:549 start_codon:yes stop_codon:yes gene_type:complete